MKTPLACLVVLGCLLAEASFSQSSPARGVEANNTYIRAIEVNLLGNTNTLTKSDIGTLQFNLLSSDVLNASAQMLDRGNPIEKEAPKEFVAKVEVELNQHGAIRYGEFLNKHSGREYELRINGKVILEAIQAHSSFSNSTSMAWFVSSMEEAQGFADSLSKK